MKTVYIVFMIIMFTGVAVWREKYGLHDPTVKTNSSVDIRVKYGNRILTLFHIITFLGGALSPMGYSYTEFMDFVVGSLSLLGSQILLQFMLIILSEFIVQYDKKTGEAVDRHEANKILKESLDRCGEDLIKARKDNSNLQDRIMNLKDEIEEHEARNRILENIIETKNRDIDRLYDRLNETKEQKKEIISNLLESIENNSKHIPEGDYIIMMDLLKKIYENIRINILLVVLTNFFMNKICSLETKNLIFCFSVN